MLLQTSIHALLSQIGVDIFSKVGLKYRQIFKTPQIDWCTTMAGTKNMNPIGRSLLRTLRIYVKTMVQRCPYKGHYEAIPFNGTAGIFSVIPKGTSQVTFQVRNDDFHMVVSLLVEFY